MQYDDKPLKEIDDTADSAAEDRFEEIITKIKTAGAEITRDEESPIYTSVGIEEYETGDQRVVEFSLNGMDFLIIRQARRARITGEGRHKSLEELPRAGIDITLKRKPNTYDQWVAVDMDDMF